VAGATITFIERSTSLHATTTMNDGHFGIGVNLRPGTHEIEASYDDSNHESSSATRGVTP